MSNGVQPPNRGFTSHHTIQQHHDPQSRNRSDKVLEYGPPTQNVRDTHHQSHESYSSHQGTSRESLDTEQQRSDSFYWQSPHSSVPSLKEEREQSLKSAAPVDAAGEQKIESTPQTDALGADNTNAGSSTFAPHSPFGIYSASALGSGGPSDWEHFGDYDAEDIDDTELYIKPRSPVKVNAELSSAELPAESSSQGMKSADVVMSDNAEPPGVIEPALASDQGKRNGFEEAIVEEIAPRPETSWVMNRVTEASDGPRKMQREANDVNQEHEPTPASIESLNPAPVMPGGDDLNVSLEKANKAWSSAASTGELTQLIDVEAGSTQQPVQHDVTSPNDGREETRLPHQQEVRIEEHENHMPSDSIHLEKNITTNLGCLEQSAPQQQSIQTDPTSNASNEEKANKLEEDTNEPTPTPASNPLQRHHDKPNQESDDSHILDPANQRTIVNQPAAETNRAHVPKTYETEDPYAGLDAWGKASLNRYIAMLREESEASSDKEKLNIFIVFANRETRLRAVLYGAENEASTAEPETSKASPVKRTITTTQKRASKALPALPEDAGDILPLRENGHSRKPSKKLSAAAILGNPRPTLKSLDMNTAPDASAMVDSPNGIEYSPGGRPMVPRPQISKSDKKSPDERASSPALDSGLSADRSNNFPIPKTTDQPSADESEAYVPFKYRDGRSEAQNYAANRLSKRQSVLRPYSKMVDVDDYSEIFPSAGSNAEDIPPVPSTGNRIPEAVVKDNEVQLDLRCFERADFDPLVSVLPEAGGIRPESLQLSELKQIMDAVPDDFSFIHQCVAAWDAKAKRTRDSNERDRHARQVESEQRIDALFDDHEIGYGDISELESGFKRSEASRKADEDRAEYHTFVSEVFDTVWTRLHFEIDQLTPSYDKYTEVLDHTTTGKDMFDQSNDHFALAPTMDGLLTLHQKLEIRHQKAFEAVLERDRRLKRTELSPWYSLGNVAKVKQLEKQFEHAEKKAILEYCKQRDIRANSLMDHLDQNTLRGVGANQDYMEMVMKAVRRIASGRAFASQPGSSEPGAGLEEVTKAKSITKALATSSEQIVQTFHVADMLLNAADYELSVAKAKRAAADPVTFQNLKEERAKEDQKLMRDLEHRLALIREDSRRTHNEIVKLLLFLGVQNGHARNSSSPPKGVNPGHEERLQNALEEAKRRNAGLPPGGKPLNMI